MNVSFGKAFVVETSNPNSGILRTLEDRGINSPDIHWIKTSGDQTKNQALFISGEEKKIYDFVKDGIKSSQLGKQITEKEAAVAYGNLDKTVEKLKDTAMKINLDA